jgi:hypothetical protein
VLFGTVSCDEIYFGGSSTFVWLVNSERTGSGKSRSGEENTRNNKQDSYASYDTGKALVHVKHLNLRCYLTFFSLC